jgi:hypothetical protein
MKIQILGTGCHNCLELEMRGEAMPTGVENG